MKNMPSREPRRKGLGTANRDLSAAALALLGFTSLFASCRPAYAQSPAVCVVSGTVLDGGSQPIVGTPVRFRVISPVMSGSAALAVQDLTTLTAAGGAWSLTLVQGLNAQVDIPAAGIAKDTVIPSGVSCPAAFTSLTLYNRGTLTPATILSTVGPSMGGDLTGASPNPTVVGLRGQQLAAGACTNGQARVYSSGTGTYTCQTVTTGAGVTSVTGGTGITVTGTTTPSVAITAGGVGPTQLAAGAAATNVGTVSGVLAGTLPSPSFAAGAIQNADVNAGAAIAWTKINKAGATAADVGAVATGSAVTSVTAGTGISLSGTGVAPIVNIANGGVTNTQLGTGAAAANLGAAGGDLAGTYPNPTIGAGVIVDADVNAGAAIAWTKVSKAGAAESDIPGLVADLADKLSKGSGGTVVGNTTFSGTTTFNGAAIFSGSFAPSGEFRVVRTADATSPSPQKVSNNAVFEGSVWNGSSAEKRLFTLRNTPTALNAGKLSFLGYSTDNVVGAELAYIDATTGAYNGPTAGTHTGPVVGAVTGNVTGNVSGTAATFTGNLTGDVTSSAMATTVQTVSGQTAATVAAGAVLANAATALNTASAIVKRDGSNNFAAGTITANLTGNVTGALTGNATTASDGLTSASGTAPLTLNLAAKSLTGTIADASVGAKGAVQLAGDLNGTATSPGVATVGGQTAANVAAGAVLANAATASSTINTIVKRDGTGNFAAGTITAALAGNATTATNVTMGGDASGPSSAATVTRIQGNPVLAGTPTNGQVYQYVTANNRFEPTTLTGTGTVTSVNASGGSTGFSFTGGPISGSGTLTMTGTCVIANGCTGQTTAGAAYNALAPTTTLGDILYANGAGTNTRLAGNTTTTGMFLHSLGSAGLATAPAWAQVDLTTDVTGTLPVNKGGTGAATLTGLLRGTGTTAIAGAAQASLTTEVTGLLPVANGGTGVGTLTGVVHASGTSAMTAGLVNLATEVTGTLPAANTAGVVKADGTVPLTADWNASSSTATPQKVSSKNSLPPVFNVEAYGAVASAAGDQSSAIQAAINAAGAAGGGIVQFGAGTYRYLTGLSITSSKVILRGAGIASTVLFLSSATANAVVFNGISGGGVENLRIIAYNDSLNTRTAGSGIYLLNSGNVRISNVWMSDCYDSLVLDGASSNFVDNIVIDSAIWSGQSHNGITVTNTSLVNHFIGVGIAASNYGVVVDTGTDTLTFVDTVVQKTALAPTVVGFLLTNTGGAHDPRWVRFENCYAETNTTNGYGWQINKGYDVELNGCYSAWGLYGINIGGASVHDVRIRGGIVTLAQQYGIIGQGATDVLVDGVTVSNNGIAYPASVATYDGIYLLDGSKNWRVANCRSGHSVWGAAPPAPAPAAKTQRYGINVATGGTSTNVVISGNDFTDNVTGAATLGAALDSTVQLADNAGTTQFGNVTMGTANGAGWTAGSASELLTLNTGGTTTDTTANLLPANSVIRSVVVRVTASITVASAFSVGDTTTAARFLGTGTGLGINSTGVGLAHVDQTGAGGPKQTAAAKVRITTTGTPGAGVVRITVFYDQFVAPSS